MIDRAIMTGNSSSQQAIADYVADKLGFPVCSGTIKADLERMRRDFKAPIQYDTITKEYRYSKPYEFSEAFIRYWSEYMVLSKELAKIC